MVKKSKKKSTSGKVRASYSAPALEKGIDILELFAKEGEAMSTSRIAEKLGRSIGEIFRMLMVLEQRGYITAVTGDKYFLSLKMYTVGARHTLIKRLTIAAVDSMRRLASDIEQSCHLVIYSQGRGVIVAQVNSPGDRIHTVRLGAEAPLMNSCSGRLLVAYAEPALRAQMLEEVPDKFRTRVSQKKLEGIVEPILKRGYESIESQQVAGVQDIGFPVFDETSTMVGALVMPYMRFLDGSEKTSLNVAHDAVSDAASEISVALGYEDA